MKNFFSRTSSRTDETGWARLLKTPKIPYTFVFQSCVFTLSFEGGGSDISNRSTRINIKYGASQEDTPRFLVIQEKIIDEIEIGIEEDADFFYLVGKISEPPFSRLNLYLTDGSEGFAQPVIEDKFTRNINPEIVEVAPLIATIAQDTNLFGGQNLNRFSRLRAISSYAGAGQAGFWTKVAQITLSGTNDFSALLAFNSTGGNPETAILSFTGRQNTGGNPSKLSVKPMNYINDDNLFLANGFKIINNGDGEPFEIWVKNRNGFGTINTYEISKASSTELTYYFSSVWQELEPVGDFEAVSEKLSDGDLELLRDNVPEAGDTLKKIYDMFKDRNTLNRRSVSDADTNIAPTDNLISYISLTAPRTAYLPNASLMPGKFVIVKDQTGAAAENNITIEAFGTQLIDGESEYVLSEAKGYVWLYSNGVNWYTFSGSNQTNVYLEKSDTYGISVLDFKLKQKLVIFADASAGDISFSLPNAFLLRGLTLKIIKIDSTSNRVFVNTQTGENVNGISSVNIFKQYDYIELESNGADYFGQPIKVDQKPPVDETYADVTALLADQNNQEKDYFYEVTDASGLTAITSGAAVLLYNANTPTGTESDYVIIWSENPLLVKRQIKEVSTATYTFELEDRDKIIIFTEDCVFDVPSGVFSRNDVLKVINGAINVEFTTVSIAQPSGYTKKIKSFGWAELLCENPSTLFFISGDLIKGFDIYESPDGSLWEVSVDNTGNIVTTAV